MLFSGNFAAAGISSNVIVGQHRKLIKQQLRQIFNQRQQKIVEQLLQLPRQPLSPQTLQQSFGLFIKSPETRRQMGRTVVAYAVACAATIGDAP